MTPYKRGDVVLVAFPFTDLTTTKMRPAIVISSEKINRKFNDIVVAAVTSNISKKPSEDELLLTTSDQTCAGLPKTSMAKLSKIVTLDQRLIRKKLGYIPTETLLKITHIIYSVLQ